MQYSLYRKYRPDSFKMVYGQDIAKKILKNAIIKNKVSHAYLFFGPRGTGKTSIAKMFSRVCNCINPIEGECCEVCKNCISSKEKNCVDIIEIDAASNNGVEEIRELKNKISLVPNELKYKVYIIDEVHMLSTGAFNALLKTLEEPPSHVIFILATTEFYKVPETIISRCQTIEFKNIDENNITRCLTHISIEENISIDEAAIREIAKNSNGGLRDAISILDKINSYIDLNSQITVADVRQSLGLITINELYNLVYLIEKNEINDLLKNVEIYSNNGMDLSKIINDLILCFRNKILEEERYDLVEKIKILNDYHSKMKNSYNRKTLFEIMILELCNKTNVRENISREIFSPSYIKNQPEEKYDKSNDETKIKIRLNNAFVEASKDTLNLVKEKWDSLKKFTFDIDEGSCICDLLDTIPVVSNSTNVILCAEYDSLVDKINKNSNDYEKILKEKINILQNIVVINKLEWERLKNEYLVKIKAGYKYTYMTSNDLNKTKIESESKLDIGNIKLEQKVEELFGNIINVEG